MRHLTAISHYVWSVNVAMCSPWHHILTLSRAPQVLSDGIRVFFQLAGARSQEPEARSHGGGETSARSQEPGAIEGN